MSYIKFCRALRKDLPQVLRDGGKPADIYYNMDTGYIYIVDREGIPVPFVEADKENFGLKVEEGFGKVGSKSEWYKDFPLLRGVFREYGQD